MIDQLKQELNGFFGQLLVSNQKVGKLETKLLQFEPPDVSAGCQRSLVACTYVAMPSATARVIWTTSFQKPGDNANARSELDEARNLIQLSYGFSGLGALV